MGTLRILIVEDELITAQAIKESLLSSGYSVSGIAQNYEEALEIFRRDSPDLALIDIELEKGSPDGIVTAQALLQIRQIPIIYVTGQSTSETDTFNRVKQTNPAAYLTKPFRLPEIALQIELAINKFNKDSLSNAKLTADLYLPFEKAHVRVAKSEILYIEARGNYSLLYLTPESYARISQKNTNYAPVLLTLNIGSLTSHLPTNFYQLSRSLIVNLDHVDRIDSSQLLIGKQEIDIPVGKHKALLERLHIIKTR
jgi:DNA-binding LytR/AlgR family response regulator